MPRVYRAMWKDGDGFPRIGRTARDLGVRVGVGEQGDVEVDADGRVGPNGGGMSVSPSWRRLPWHRIPARLRSKLNLKSDRGKGPTGPDESACFRFGDGPFEAGGFADDLALKPDSPKHGVVEPNSLMPLESFEAALAATRPDWIIDES